MKIKLLITIAAIAACNYGANAQAGKTPDYKLAAQLQIIITKVNMPVDSAAVYLDDFQKLDETKPSETVFKSRLADGVYIIFQKDAAGKIALIVTSMPAVFLTTVQKFIAMMGMVASGTAAPPGYTAYATPKYAAFINPEVKPGILSLVMLQGGK
jgi:hypothetical protein